MTKHLFRINLTGPSNEEQEIYSELTDSLKRTDDAIAEYMPVHVMDLPFPEEPITPYGCELIVDWGDAVTVKPALYENSDFASFMKKSGLKKDIIACEYLSEGGCFVFGNEFMFISDVFRQVEQQLPDSSGRRYFLPSITSFQNSHINCDYLILDKIKMIYFSGNVANSAGEKEEAAMEKLKDTAKKEGFALKEYESFDKAETRGLIDEVPFSIDSSGLNFTPKLGDYRFNDLFRKINGINAIIYGNKLFSGFVHPDDREYLAKNGIEAIEIPIEKTCAGAGLHCIYGEFYL